MRYLLELGLCLGHFECGCVEFGGGMRALSWCERVRLVGLESMAVLDGEAWVAIGCCCDGCAFEVEVADACRSAATEGRALTFTTCTTI